MARRNGGPPKAIGYVRVSTVAQGENGYGLDAQRDEIERYCERAGFELVAFIPDVMSGRKTDRLYGRAAAVAAIRNGVADVLVLKELDRATRDTRDGLDLMLNAKDEGWRIVAVKGEDSDAIGKLELTIKLAFAEEERDKISERTKAGLARARREGKQLGHPDDFADVVQRIIRMRRRDHMGAKAIATALTTDGVPAPRGDVWHYSTVRGVLKRWEAS